jgi:hypothetical protein
MDDWQAITRAEFEALLLSEIEKFDAADHAIWSRHKVELRTAPIHRSAHYGIESVFVVAAIGDQILFFDDVEDEFGTARLPAAGPLQDYGTYGELRVALRGLARHA